MRRTQLHAPGEPLLLANKMLNRTFGGKYELSPQLGTGGMGSIFRATARDTGEQVAVKIIDREPTGYLREIYNASVGVQRVLAGGGYSNLVRIIEVVEDGESIGIVMELVKGENLRTYLRRVGKLSPNEALTLFRQVLRGLSELHARGITHRDVKPDNILLDESKWRPIVKIADFGLAYMDPVPALTENNAVGTPGYMPPEVISGAVAGPSADMYAAGIILYEMLAGRLPFSNGDFSGIFAQHLSAIPPPIEELEGDKSGLAALLTSLLAKRPGDRPSADEALARLDDIGPVHFREPAWGASTSDHAVSRPSFGTVVATTVIRPRHLVVLSALVTDQPLRDEEIEHSDGILHRFDFGSNEFLLVDRLDGDLTLNWTTDITAGNFTELVGQYLKDNLGGARVTVGVDDLVDEMDAEVGVALARLGGDSFDRACRFFRFDAEDLTLAYQILPGPNGSGRTTILGVSGPRLTLDRVLPLLVRTGTEQVVAHALSVRVDALPARLSAAIAAQERTEQVLPLFPLTPPASHVQETSISDED